MPKSLLDLAEQMNDLAGSIADQASEAAKGVALAIVKDLVQVTPVDTSNALSNWQVSVGSPKTNEIPPYFPGTQGSTQRVSAAQTINEATAALGNKKPGETIYIANNAPYIQKLNEGSSKQAPAGFVERSELIGRVLAANFKVKI